MIVYLLFRLAVFVIKIIPFPLLYICSDGIAFLLNYILRYRRNVILKNLRYAFPQKPPLAIKEILKKTYKNLSDISLEGIKGMSCSQDELIKRYKFLNPDVVHDIFKNNRSAIGLVAHYNNWEWGAFATSPQIKGQVVGVSKSIHNQYIDRFIKNNRARFGSKIIHMNETARALLGNQSTPTLFVLIADQSPSNSRTAHWLTFLNQETACLTGPDKIARRTNYPVIYFDVQRVKRGYYEITATLLHANPSRLRQGEVTDLYMKKLEKTIVVKPENWLWSHRRWKKKRIKIED
jgi:Kdo2-lipid IVA lauroyltransferase/acyltransferase